MIKATVQYNWKIFPRVINSLFLVNSNSSRHGAARGVQDPGGPEVRVPLQCGGAAQPGDPREDEPGRGHGPLQGPRLHR